MAIETRVTFNAHLEHGYLSIETDSVDTLKEQMKLAGLQVKMLKDLPDPDRSKGISGSAGAAELVTDEANTDPAPAETAKPAEPETQPEPEPPALTLDGNVRPLFEELMGLKDGKFVVETLQKLGATGEDNKVNIKHLAEAKFPEAIELASKRIEELKAANTIAGGML